MPLGVARGIAHGIDRATKNIMEISKAKKKLEYDQERDKLTDSVKKAQIKKYEFDLGEAESKANRTQQMFERISATREGFEAGVKTPGPGTIPVGDMMPTGSRFSSDGITMSGPPHRTRGSAGKDRKLTFKQQRDVNILKNQLLEGEVSLPDPQYSYKNVIVPIKTRKDAEDVIKKSGYDVERFTDVLDQLDTGGSAKGSGGEEGLSDKQLVVGKSYDGRDGSTAIFKGYDKNGERKWQMQ